MSGYADPELLVATWLGERLNLKTWANPNLPHDWQFTAPIGHVQRGQGFGDTALTLDECLLDISWYAADPDHARAAAEATRTEIRLNLPRHTFSNGAFVTGTFTVSAPTWAPDPKVYRRAAAYRVILHGMTA